MGKSYKFKPEQKGGVGRDNPSYTRSLTDLNQTPRAPTSGSEPHESAVGETAAGNGSAINQKDEVIEMDTLSEEEKIQALPPEMQERVRNMAPEMRAAFLTMTPETRALFKAWPIDRKLRILNMTPAEVDDFNKLSEKGKEDFFSEPAEEETQQKPKEMNGNAQGGGPNQEMMQRFQALPPEMRQVFMNMSDKDRQKFIELRKKAADWPEEKKRKMFQKMYKDYMKKQARDIIKARRQERKNMKLVGFFELFRFADGVDKLLMIVGTLAAMITGCAFPVNLLFYGQVVNEFIKDEQDSISGNGTSTGNIEDTILELIPYFIAIGCTVLVTGNIMMSFWSLTSERQTRRIRSLAFHNILHQHIGWFDLHQTGELNVRLSDDVLKIQMGIGDKIATFVQWVTTFFAGYTVGFIQGWQLTLVILAVAPLMVITVGVIAVVQQRFTVFEQLAYARAGAIAEEVLGAIRTVAAFGGEKKESDRYRSRLDGAKMVGIKRGLVTGCAAGLIWVLIFGAFALAFWYGTQLVINEGYEGGDILQVFMGVLIGTMSLGQAMPNLEYISSARGAASAVWEIIDLVSEIDSSSSGGTRPPITGNISFQDVHFTYPARQDVKIMSGFNLEVKVGSTVALVGPSGCGKSTAVQLLQRFYDPQYGKVLVDGHDIKEMNVAWLRENIGVVSQEPVLFATTIAENIRYGREGVKDEEIEWAARNANAFNFIDALPEKFNTLVGERGAQLSGGQKQRIAIARALVRNPKILLLDEATSALDTESESIVQQALERASKGRTTVVIAHRLSTIKNADVIVGIINGEVHEVGSHSELMEKEGIYYHLVMSQTAAEKSEDDVCAEYMSDEEEAMQDYVIKRSGSVDGQSLRRSFRRSLRKQDRQLSRELSRQVSSTPSEAVSWTEEDEEMLVQKLPRPAWRRMIALNAPEWYFVVGGCIAAVFTGALQPCFAIIFSEIMGNFALIDQNEMEENSKMYAGLLAGLGAVVGTATFFQNYFLAKAGENLTMRLRDMAFSSMLRQDISWFDDKSNQVGALTSRLATDASLVKGATGQQLATLIQSSCSMGASLMIAFIFGWKLAFVVVSFLPLIVISGMVQGRIVKGANKGGKKAIEEGGKISSEAIDNVRTVAALNKENKFEERFNVHFDASFKKGKRKAAVFGTTYGISQGIIFFAYAAAFAYGAQLVGDGEMEFTNVFRVFAAITFGGQALGRASALTPDVGKAKMAAAKMFQLFDRKPVPDSSDPEGEKPDDCKGRVRFHKARFHYPTRPDVKVLQGLEIEVKPGNSLALVGSSGCGKSTTVQLTERFYDVSHGSVTLDGVDVRDLNIQWLRAQLGIVQQEPILFDASIRDNIAYGDNNRIVTMPEVIEAARNANIHNFIDSLPQGYDTNVGDKGTQLSGGQKQRVAIARALVRNPKVLLLDEATSALDTESERVVQEALDNARQGRTCIMIAHRLSTIQNADVICVIHNGQVVEQGNHNHLMDLQGYYYRLQQAQIRTKKDS